MLWRQEWGTWGGHGCWWCEWWRFRGGTALFGKRRKRRWELQNVASKGFVLNRVWKLLTNRCTGGDWSAEDKKDKNGYILSHAPYSYESNTWAGGDWSACEQKRQRFELYSLFTTGMLCRKIPELLDIVVKFRNSWTLSWNSGIVGHCRKIPEFPDIVVEFRNCWTS